MVDGVCRSEVMNLVSRLSELAERVGLKSYEIERLISVHSGVWPLSSSRCQLWWPTEVQAERVRALFGVCSGALAAMGHEAPAWLRRRNAGLSQSPIRFLLSCPEAIFEMRDILMWEAGQC